MPRIGPSGDPLIDGLLWGVKWGGSTLTFAFPTSTSQFLGYPNGGIRGFEAFTAVQKDAVRDVMAELNGLINVNIVETADPTQGNLRFEEATEVDQDGFGSPGRIDTAVGTPPDSTFTPPYGWGDTFFNHTDYENPIPGSYDYHSMIHELGHALGLKHGHARQLSPSGAFFFPKLPTEFDSMEFSVMTYRSNVGGPTGGAFTNEKWGFAQSFMMLDIAALQYMYGADYGTNSGNTVYSWKPNSGETFINGAGQGAPGANRIFMTIWDGGGIDTYDFSAYATNLNIDLDPGGWCLTSRKQTAVLDADSGIRARGNVFNALLHDNDARSLIENAVGGSGNDTIAGNFGDNDLDGRGGADKINGRGGQDLLTGGEGHDKLTGGAGSDGFVYRFIESAGADKITDFGGNDVLFFEKPAYGAIGREADGTGLVDSKNFVARGDNAAQDANDFFIFRKSDHSLWFDADGNGADDAIQIAVFNNGANITAGDLFIFG